MEKLKIIAYQGIKNAVKWRRCVIFTKYGDKKICRKFLFQCIGWFSTKLGEVLYNFGLIRYNLQLRWYYKVYIIKTMNINFDNIANINKPE